MTDATFVLVCEGCGEFILDDETGIIELVDMKEHPMNHLGSAETLRDIHDRKATSHRPYIRTETEDDEHVPSWAEGGYRSPPRSMLREQARIMQQQ